MQSITLQEHRNGMWFVAALALIWAAVFSYLSILRFNSFVPGSFDMGIMLQTVWNIANGHGFTESINMGYAIPRFWVAHWEFIYFVVALFYKIFPSPNSLLIFQATIVAIGVFPVYLIAIHKLNDRRLAIFFAVMYLMYPALHNAVLFDVHGIPLAAPFLAFAFYYLLIRKYIKFIVFGIVALLCREESALILSMMGLYTIVFDKKWKIGVPTIVISIVYFLAWFKLGIIREVLGLPPIVIKAGSEGPLDVFMSNLTNPVELFKLLAKKYNITYLIAIFAPVAFLSVFSLRTLLVAAPMFAIYMFSNYYNMHTIEHHYSAILAPFVLFSTVYGYAFLREKLSDKIITYLPYALLIPMLICFFYYSNVFDSKKWIVTDHHKLVHALVDEIPPEASVTATSKIVPHVSERQFVYDFADNIDTVDYIIYDFSVNFVRMIDRSKYLSDATWPMNDEIRSVLLDHNYGLETFSDGLAVFKKGHPYAQGIETFKAYKGKMIKSDKVVNSVLGIAGYELYPVLKKWRSDPITGFLIWEKAIHFSIYWHALNDIVNDYQISFILQKDDEQYNIDHTPLWGMEPITNWKSGATIYDDVFWACPEKMSAGVYQVYIDIKNDQNVEPEYLFNLNIK